MSASQGPGPGTSGVTFQTNVRGVAGGSEMPISSRFHFAYRACRTRNTLRSCERASSVPRRSPRRCAGTRSRSRCSATMASSSLAGTFARSRSRCSSSGSAGETASTSGLRSRGLPPPPGRSSGGTRPCAGNCWMMWRRSSRCLRPAAGRQARRRDHHPPQTGRLRQRPRLRRRTPAAARPPGPDPVESHRGRGDRRPPLGRQSRPGQGTSESGPGQGQRGEHMEAFFGCLYFAALRPAEAVALREADCVLPARGWGRIDLAVSQPRAGTDWAPRPPARRRLPLAQRRRARHRGRPPRRPRRRRPAQGSTPTASTAKQAPPTSASSKPSTTTAASDLQTSRALVVSLGFLDHRDLPEGIRAAIIDKDRSPQWKRAVRVRPGTRGFRATRISLSLTCRIPAA